MNDLLRKKNVHAPSLRELLAGKEPVLAPGAYDALSARVIEQAGFPVVYMTGFGSSAALLGQPDVGLLSQTEMADHARRLAAAVSVPVLADADTGYGNPLNVRRTVQLYEAAGVAGLHLEDQVAPKRCGHLDGKQVIPALDMAKKIRAAVRARTDTDFFLIARTDARSIHGLQDAIDRANRYMDAGADAIFPESLQSAEEFATFAQQVHAPLLANMTEFGKTPLLSVSEFAAMGYAMVIFPMTAFRVMMRAAQETYSELKQNGTQAALMDSMQTRKELYELIRYSDYERFDRQIAEEVGE